MVRHRFVFVACLLLGGRSLLAEGTPSPSPAPVPCTGPEWRQLDFWVGEWDLTWPATGGNAAGTGSNRIEKILGGCVVEENFRQNGSAPLVGHSVSSYDPRSKAWRQTWVDNQGSYLDFEGELDGDRMIFARKATSREGKPMVQRMLFLNVTRDSLDWRWERSEDGGKTWQLLWPIHYLRRGTSASGS